MKKTGTFLGALAVLFALSGAVASQEFTTVPGYEFIDNPVGEPDECVFRQNCDTEGDIECRVNPGGPILQEQITTTTCGVALKMKVE